MSKIGLIVKREYLRRVQKKSFLLITFLAPFLFAALVFVPLWLSTLKGDEVRQVAIIDATGHYAPLFQDTESYHFIAGEGDLEQYRQRDSKEVFAILQITDDLLAHPQAVALYSSKQIPGELSRLVNSVLSKQLEQEKLASYDIPNLDQIIRESRVKLDVQTIKWGDNGEETRSSSEVSSLLGLFATVAIYMFILIYGAMVMQGVMEEKTNRIVEIMISSVRPFDLMMGKIIGIGLVGLTQIFLWGVITVALVTVGAGMFGGGAEVDPALLAQSNLTPATQDVAQLTDNNVLALLAYIDWRLMAICFLLYFVGGYILYASLFAAIGSAVDSQEDAQQFVAPMSVFMVFALYAGMYSIQNPDGPLAFWCSMIPLTSPIVMMVRLPFDVPSWQIALSIVLLYASFIGAVWVSGKIYRVGILMYGKKVNLKELLRWIRQVG